MIKKMLIVLFAIMLFSGCAKKSSIQIIWNVSSNMETIDFYLFFDPSKNTEEKTKILQSFNEIREQYLFIYKEIDERTEAISLKGSSIRYRYYVNKK